MKTSSTSLLKFFFLRAFLFMIYTGTTLAATTVTRSISPSAYTPGSTVTVTVTITGDTSVRAFSVEETPPAGWTITNLSKDGVIDGNHVIRWGVFVMSVPSIANHFDPNGSNSDGELMWDDTAQTGSVKWGLTSGPPPVSMVLTYLARPAVGTTGSQAFSGKVSTDGITIPIGGTTSIVRAPIHPADTSTNFAIDTTEYSSALFCWQTHCPTIPTTYFSNLLYLRKNNSLGLYHYDDSVGSTPPAYWVWGQ